MVSRLHKIIFSLIAISLYFSISAFAQDTLQIVSPRKFGYRLDTIQTFRDATRLDTIIIDGSTLYVEAIPDTITQNRPLSRLGITVGGNAPIESSFDVEAIGFRLEGFCHQTISRSWFISIDASWTHSNFIEIVEINDMERLINFPRNELCASIGLNVFLSHSGIRPYLGVSIGAMRIDNYEFVKYYYRDDMEILYCDEVSGYGSAKLGLSMPISEYLCIDANILGKATVYGGSVCGNVGLSYLVH
jgi:hypothetical protein